MTIGIFSLSYYIVIIIIPTSLIQKQYQTRIHSLVENRNCLLLSFTFEDRDV
jgi:hypothetical protein